MAAKKNVPTSTMNTQSGSLVNFSYYAPNAKSVSIAGTFNNWSIGLLRLEKDRLGTWRGSANLKKGSYQYRVVVDGVWVDDPNAKKTITNSFGSKNAVVDVK